MYKILVILLLPICISCDWAGNKAKETVHKSGEVVGKAGTEFVNGLEKGVEKSLAFQISLSDDLKNKVSARVKSLYPMRMMEKIMCLIPISFSPKTLTVK